MLAHIRQKVFQRLSHSFSTGSLNYEEIRIPVPWGHIAGKWWGPQDKRPIVCLHGWQDNCGSFETLIPHLPSHLGYLAIDCPGHGYSSQLPSGVFYHGIDGVILLKRIVDYFNWPKVSLLGHSLGAMTGYQYAVLYPESVDFMICLDNFKPVYRKDGNIERMAKAMDNFVKYDKLNNLNSEPPSYSYDVLEKILQEGTRNSIALESCKYILERNIAASKKEPNKYYFARDPRLKTSIMMGWSQKDTIDATSRVTWPLLVFKASQSPFFERKEQTLEVVELLRKINKYFEYHIVEGTHHVHLNNPERVADKINDFIKRHDIADRSEGGIKLEIKVSTAN